MEKIIDRIRGVELVATPEEKVRQRIICWLEENGINPACIGREVKVEVAGRVLRADLVVYSKEGKPYLVIECKAPSVAISENTLLQAFEYNRELKAEFVMASNGKQTYCFTRKEDGFKPIGDISEIFSSRV